MSEVINVNVRFVVVTTTQSLEITSTAIPKEDITTQVPKDTSTQAPLPKGKENNNGKSRSKGKASKGKASKGKNA